MASMLDWMAPSTTRPSVDAGTGILGSVEDRIKVLEEEEEEAAVASIRDAAPLAAPPLPLPFSALPLLAFKLLRLLPPSIEPPLRMEAAELMEAVEAVESRDAVDPPESGDFTSWVSTNVSKEKASSW